MVTLIGGFTQPSEGFGKILRTPRPSKDIMPRCSGFCFATVSGLARPVNGLAIVHRRSLPSHVHRSEFQLRFRLALVCCLAEPAKGLCIILIYADAASVQVPKDELGSASPCSAAFPSQRAASAWSAGHPLTCHVHGPEEVLCCGVTVLGGASEIANGSCITLLGSQPVQGARILGSGRVWKTAINFFRDAFAAEIVQLGTSQVDLFACCPWRFAHSSRARSR